MKRCISVAFTTLALCASALAFRTFNFNGTPVKWPDARCAMYHDPSWVGSPSFVAEFYAGADAWTAVPASNFRFLAGGSSPSTNLRDTRNGRSDAYFDSLSPNVYAVAFVDVGGPTAIDRDVVFNSRWTWSTRGTGGVDFRSVAIHELGHVLGLHHETTKQSVMKPTYDGRSLFHKPFFDDEEGCRFIYPEPGPPTAPPSNADLAIENVRFEPVDATAGDRIRVTFTMRNVGTQLSRAFASTVYLIEGAAVDSDDRYLRAKIHGGIPPDGVREGSLLVQLPDVLEPRTFRIGVILDAQRATGDRDRSNNSGVSQSVIKGGGEALVIGPGYRVTGSIIPFGTQSFALDLSAGTRLRLASRIDGGTVGVRVVQEANGKLLVDRRYYRRAKRNLTVPDNGRYLIHLSNEDAGHNTYDFRVGAKPIRYSGTLDVTLANQLHFPGYQGSIVTARIRSRSDVRPTAEWVAITAPVQANRRGTRLRLGRVTVPETGPLVLVLSQGDGPAGSASYKVRITFPRKGPYIRR